MTYKPPKKRIYNPITNSYYKIKKGKIVEVIKNMSQEQKEIYYKRFESFWGLRIVAEYSKTPLSWEMIKNAIKFEFYDYISDCLYYSAIKFIDKEILHWSNILKKHKCSECNNYKKDFAMIEIKRLESLKKELVDERSCKMKKDNEELLRYFSKIKRD